MAGELISGPSLGFGIGLQDRIDYAPLNQAAANIYQHSEAKKARDEAAKRKAADDWSKYASNLKITGDIDPMYEQQTKEIVGGHIAKLAKFQREKPYEDPYNIEEISKDKASVDIGLKVINNNTAAIKQFDALRIPLMSSGNYEVNKENLAIFNKARETGNPKLIEDIKDPEGNSVVSGGAINPSSLQSAIYKEKPFDWQDSFLKSNIKPVIIDRGSQAPSGEFIATQDDKLVDVAASRSQLGTIIDNPLSKVGQGALASAKGDREAAIDLLFNSYGYKGHNVRKQGLKAKSAWGQTVPEMVADFSTPQEYNAGKTSTGENVTFTSLGGVGFKTPIKTTASTATGTINTKDLTEEEGSLVGKEISLGGIIKVPTYEEDGKTYIAPKEGGAVLKHTGKKVGSTNVVVGSSVEKVWDPIEQRETTETKSYYLPLTSALKSTIIKNKEGSTIEALEKSNAVSSSKKPISTKSSAPKKGDKMTFRQGPATFNGTKWVLDK